MTDMQARKLAVLYAAKSTADPKGSIGKQLDDGRELAKAAEREVVGSYNDEAKSAYHGSRGAELEAAMAHAAELAHEGNDVALVVQHSDRLARGDAIKGKHLVEYTLWGIKESVHLLSVQDQEMLPEGEMALLMGSIGGMRNNQDSARKSKSTKGGLRKLAEEGKWRGGIVPGGYDAEYQHDGKGKVIDRKLVKHTEDRAAYELLWKLAEEGRSVQAISLEMNRRGYKTRPPQQRIKPKDFDTSRVIQALSCPAYAGLIVWDGETFAAEWEPYVDVETFHRLKAERHDRCHHTKRKRGRPPVGYLLAELAVCGLCGEPMHAETDRRRSDGSVARRYTCRAHRERHREDASWCPCERVDAEAVDRAVLGELGRLLSNMDDLRAQLESGQRAERSKLERIAAEASSAALDAEVAAERATAEFADADDAEDRALLKDAAKVKRTQAKRERSRADAALDALAGLDVEEVDPEAAMHALYERLAGQLADAGEDLKALNAALRETFASFELHSDGRIVPSISPDAAAEFARTSDVNLRMSLGGGLLRLPAFVV